MKTFVVDTDVASVIFRQLPQAALYEKALVGNDLVLSFMTVAELEEWPLRNNWGWARRKQLAQYIATYRVVYVNRELCRIFARARAALLAAGRPVETRDIWVAATALLLRAPLATNNVRHFQHLQELRLFHLPSHPQ